LRETKSAVLRNSDASNVPMLIAGTLRIEQCFVRNE
jgi:hypothetical protein